jgi:hypothetical protein
MEIQYNHYLETFHWMVIIIQECGDIAQFSSAIEHTNMVVLLLYYLNIYFYFRPKSPVNNMLRK